jgi:hypothetical protein
VLISFAYEAEGPEHLISPSALRERSAARAAGRVPPAIADGWLATFFGRAAAQLIDLIALPRESFASRDHEFLKQLIRPSM